RLWRRVLRANSLRSTLSNVVGYGCSCPPIACIPYDADHSRCPPCSGLGTCSTLSNSVISDSFRGMPGPIQAIERAAAILQLLARGSNGLGLGDIAASLDLPKGTAHGILRTL